MRGPGRAEALAGATALAVLIAGTVGAFTKGSTDDVPSALTSPGPDATVAPYESEFTEPSVTGPAYRPRASGTATAPGMSAPPGGGGAPGAFVRGPASGTPVMVGVHFNDNEGAAAQFGVGGLPDISDAEVRAVITQVNKAGGLAGRPIEPVFHRTDPLEGSFDSQGQAACERFTQDEKVQYVVDNALSPSKVLLSCVAQRQIPLVWELHMAMVTNAETSKFANYLYRPTMPNADRYRFVIDGLHEAGFFKSARVGLLRYDSPEGALISNKVFRPRLKALGIPVVAEAAMTQPSNAGGAAGLGGQSSNAVLDFKDKEVSHVLFIPTGGAIPLTFIPAAASQGFEPAYGLTTADAPDFIGKNFPESQLRKAMVVGWAPLLDGDEYARGEPIARCKKALADAGLPWDYQIQSYCDAFYFMHKALYAQQVVSAATLRRGVDSLGTSYASPVVAGTLFNASRHDGPTRARLMRYDATKEGWKYFGSLFSFS
jgi:hypothetical protein